MKSLFQDLRYTVRQLKDNPGFTLTTLLSLALGIAATTAIFSVIYAVVLNPYPYRAPDRMVHLRLREKSGQEEYVGLRLKAGIGQAAANAALAPLIDQFVRQTPNNFPQGQFEFTVVGLNEDLIHRLGGTLALLFSAVPMLLAIGCGNVSILLLARGTARQQEFAVRSAIGASRRRIVRQLLTEALTLSLTGAGLGVLLAFRVVAVIVAMLPENSFPHEAAIHINLPVLVFSTAIALATGVLFGLWPALRLSRPDLSSIIHAGTRKIAGRLGARGANNTLVAAQIALTLLLLAGAGASIQAFLRMMHISLGYDPHNVMAVAMPIDSGAYNTWVKRSTYYEEMRKKVADVSGVTMTAIQKPALRPPVVGRRTSISKA